MFEKVLVGIDEETRGRDAVALARRLVKPTGRLIFANVHSGAAALGKGSTGALEAIERDESLAFLRAVIEECGVDADACCFAAFRVGAGLHRLAESTGADLVVLGSSRLGAPGRVRLNDRIKHSLNGAPCALGVAPLGYGNKTAPIADIGVGYDGSQESRCALALAGTLAAQLRAEVSVFEALPLPLHAFLPGVRESYAEVVRQTESAACGQLTAETGLDADAVCGDSAEEIAVFSGGVDLLVVGSRDYGPLGRLVHGSTTDRLLRIARSPILITTKGARQQVGQDRTFETGAMQTAAAGA